MTTPPESGPIRVMIVDDHALVRSAVRQTITGPEMMIVAEAASAEEAVALALETRPDVLLVDIVLPGRSGVDLVRELSPRLPETKIVMLTGSLDERGIVEALRNGAVGYLTKDMSPGDLARAIRNAHLGDFAMPAWLAGDVIEWMANAGPRMDAAQDPDGFADLSLREREVLRLLADGLTDREISESLTVSIRTVESHVSNILRKLGLRNRAEAAGRYHRRA